MSSPAIDKYYTSVQKIKDWGGSHKETAIDFTDHKEQALNLLKRVTRRRMS
jgi:hypothetical protein